MARWEEKEARKQAKRDAKLAKKEEKLAVLDYLITKFEPGVEYKEMQVNMILKKVNIQ